MADRQQVARTLLIVGMLLLPAPLYLGPAAEAITPAPQTSQGYHAEQIDLGDESDRKSFISGTDRQITVTQFDFSADPADPYRWNATTWRVLETAMTNGSATVSDAGIREELREIDTKHQFVREDSDDGREYYRLTIEQSGTIVRTEPASDAEVATAIAEQAPHYENLTSAEKRTVDAILNASSSEYGTHRPQVNDAFVDQLPTMIWKGDSLYDINGLLYVDEVPVGVIGFYAGFGVAAIGLVFIVVGKWMGKSN